MTDKPRAVDIDEARLRPHLRSQKPKLIVSPDNGTTHIDTVNLGAAKRSTSNAALGNPGDLRGIPVVGARGVGGVSPGTQPEQTTINKLMRQAGRAA